jgi:diadenosine tetraphosphate (Ap4A) HIT family hydrolase
MPSEGAGAANCCICTLIARIRSGPFDDLVAELPSSYLILGDAQFYRGYCVMLAKRHATELFLMPTDEARALLDDMRLVAEAIAAATGPWKMNYECLGNQEAHIHWHLFPRYKSDELRTSPVWLRPESERKVSLASAERATLLAALREQIVARFPDARLPGQVIE